MSRNWITLHRPISNRVSTHLPLATSARTFTLSSHSQGYYNSYSHTGDTNNSDDKTGSNKPEPTSQKSAPAKANTGSKDLDPDIIKGPGGLTMTQIGKLVQQSRVRDLEQNALKQKQQQQRQNSASSKSSK
ncbi:hypothetical protein BGZ72_008625 [Mortierella alpina]|nr:hypothetical protein BGZ72_008625 [Mortierella alpina]